MMGEKDEEENSEYIDEEEYAKMPIFKGQEPWIPLSREEIDIIVDLLNKEGHIEIVEKILEQMDAYEFIDREPTEEEIRELGIYLTDEDEEEEYEEEEETVEYFDLLTYNEMIRSNIPVLVMFTSIACPPCAMAKPILKELEKEYKDKLNFGLMSLDEDESIIRHSEELKIDSIPAFFIFYKGKILNSWIGMQPSYNESKAWLKEKIEKMLKKL